MKRLPSFFLLIFCYLLSVSPIHAQESYSPILFIYDGSGSMWGQIEGQTKKEIAANVFSETVGMLPAEQKIGLIAYGHREKKDCEDIEVLADLGNTSKESVIGAVNDINPLGRTPLAASAMRAIEMIREADIKATVILITDGIESCGGQICDVIKSAKEEGIEIRLHIVGFGLKEGETEDLVCAAKVGDGMYYDASDAGELTSVLLEATSQTIDEPESNFIVYAEKNGIAIDAMVRAYATDGKRRPKAVRTYRDTGYLYLTPGMYDLEVSALEGSQVKPLTVKGVEIPEGDIVTRVISFDAGKFNFTTTNNGEGWDCMIKILDQEGKQVGGGRTYGRSKIIEVNPGTYDIQIQALRMNGPETNTQLEDIELTGGTKDVSYEFSSATIIVNPTVNGNTIDCIVKFIDTKTGTNVAGGRSYTKGVEEILNPGTYEISVQPLKGHAEKGTKTITITLEKGQEITREIKF